MHLGEVIVVTSQFMGIWIFPNHNQFSIFDRRDDYVLLIKKNGWLCILCINKMATMGYSFLP